MVGSEPSFRACLAVALGLAVDELPLPDLDPDVSWRQWLAARNLGLVPVADPGLRETGTPMVREPSRERDAATS